jgi:serine/threonine protein kinase HipA of HipAB toxin-antitoxin module
MSHRRRTRVPDSRLERFGDGYRVFVSAMTLIKRQDGHAGASYVDLAQLYRRIVFNVLVGNRDAHLRDLGFIPDKTGWRHRDSSNEQDLSCRPVSFAVNNAND